MLIKIDNFTTIQNQNEYAKEKQNERYIKNLNFIRASLQIFIVFDPKRNEGISINIKIHWPRQRTVGFVNGGSNRSRERFTCLI